MVSPEILGGSDNPVFLHGGHMGFFLIYGMKMNQISQIRVYIKWPIASVKILFTEMTEYTIWNSNESFIHKILNIFFVLFQIS